MKKNFTPLVDEHLKAIQGMKEAATDDYFYTRLKARMQKDESGQGWSFPLKPIWVIGTLALFLAMNAFMLLQKSKMNETSATTTQSPIQDFAKSYDQSVSSY